MADEFTSEESFESKPMPPPKKRSGGMLIMAIPFLLIQVGASYYVTMTLLFPHFPEPEVVEEEVVVEEEEEKIAYNEGHTLEDQTVNVFDGTRSRFLVFNATMETPDGSVLEEMKKRDRQLKDLFLREIATFPFEMLANVEHRDSLANYMRDRVNSLLMEGEVRKIYFDQWVVAQ